MGRQELGNIKICASVQGTERSGCSIFCVWSYTEKYVISGCVWNYVRYMHVCSLKHKNSNFDGHAVCMCDSGYKLVLDMPWTDV